MCGRTSLFVPREALEDRFDARVVADGGYRPRYNIAPGDPLEVITGDAPDAIDRYTWGLVPGWADDPDGGFINARSESAHGKPAFRDAWASRPCLVLSSGFYEWAGVGSGPEQPYRVYREDDPAFAMAGLWEEWRDVDGNPVRTVTVLTTDPNDTVRSTTGCPSSSGGTRRGRGWRPIRTPAVNSAVPIPTTTSTPIPSRRWSTIPVTTTLA